MFVSRCKSVRILRLAELPSRGHNVRTVSMGVRYIRGWSLTCLIPCGVGGSLGGNIYNTAKEREMEAIIIIGIPMLYFLPAIVAGFRDHRNTGAVFVLNLLLGWTFIGWVIALVWAMTNGGKND
jgi:hypothetical protein